MTILPLDVCFEGRTGRLTSGRARRLLTHSRRSGHASATVSIRDHHAGNIGAETGVLLGIGHAQPLELSQPVRKGLEATFASGHAEQRAT